MNKNLEHLFIQYATGVPLLDQVILGDVLEVLRQLPDESVDVSVTSPPYNKQERMAGDQCKVRPCQR